MCSRLRGTQRHGLQNANGRIVEITHLERPSRVRGGRASRGSSFARARPGQVPSGRVPENRARRSSDVKSLLQIDRNDGDVREATAPALVDPPPATCPGNEQQPTM